MLVLNKSIKNSISFNNQHVQSKYMNVMIMALQFTCLEWKCGITLSLSLTLCESFSVSESESVVWDWGRLRHFFSGYAFG